MINGKIGKKRKAYIILMRTAMILSTVLTASLVIFLLLYGLSKTAFTSNFLSSCPKLFINIGEIGKCLEHFLT